MKKILLAILILSAGTVDAQSLREALYSGRLKNDTGVIRSSDDIQSKMDSVVRKPVATTMIEDGDSTISVDDFTAPPDPSAPTPSVITKVADNRDNEAIIKDFMDELLVDLKNNVLPNNKVKSGTYQILVTYAIGTDGLVSVKNVAPAPESDYLREQVANRIKLTSPQLHPVLNSAGQPRTAIKKYSFSITK